LSLGLIKNLIEINAANSLIATDSRLVQLNNAR
jgi:hypothetical protein